MDIAFEFCSAISPVFKLYLIKEFQRLKEEENNRLNLGWNLQRTLAKINYDGFVKSKFTAYGACFDKLSTNGFPIT